MGASDAESTTNEANRSAKPPSSSPSRARTPADDAHDRLVSAHVATRPSLQRAAQQRVETARAAAGRLAAQLPGHGVDLDRFAASYGTTKYASFDKAAVASRATYDFVRSVLARQPELADRAIEVRSDGLSATDRQIVKRVVARSGSQGLKKYAEAERVIRELRAFSTEERADVAAFMRAGESFDEAVRDERKQIARVAKEEAEYRATPSLTAKYAEAANRVQTDVRRWDDLASKLNIVFLGVPKVERHLEFWVGAGVGIGTIGSIIVGAAKTDITGDPAHFRRALKDAEKAGGHMAGELTDKIAAAGRFYVQFNRQHAQYVAQGKLYQEAAKRGDVLAMEKVVKRMDSLERDMATTLRAFDATLTNLAKKYEEFDEAQVRAVAEAAVLAASLATAGVGGEAVEGVKEVSGVITDTAFDSLKAEAGEHVGRKLAGAKH